MREDRDVVVAVPEVRVEAECRPIRMSDHQIDLDHAAGSASNSRRRPSTQRRRHADDGPHRRPGSTPTLDAHRRRPSPCRRVSRRRTPRELPTDRREAPGRSRPPDPVRRACQAGVAPQANRGFSVWCGEFSEVHGLSLAWGSLPPHAGLLSMFRWAIPHARTAYRWSDAAVCSASLG